MDIDTLQLFVEVVQHGSFAAAARHHDVDPSWVSRAMTALERELRVRLFQRTTRRLALTEAGAVYYERMRPVLEGLRQAREETHDVAAKPAGLLRVTTSVAFGHMQLVPLLPAWRKAYPALSTELLLTDSIVDLIAERVDVAIRLGTRFDSALIGSRLMAVRYRVVASPAYLRRAGAVEHPAELSRRDCPRIPLDGFNSRWRLRDRGGRVQDVDINGTLVISSPLSVRQAALDGLGPALLADWMINGDLVSGALVDLFPEHEATATDFETAAWILYPSRTYLPLKVRLFIDFMRRHLAPVAPAAKRRRVRRQAPIRA